MSTEHNRVGLRQQLLVDVDVQGVLLKRFVGYGTVCVAYCCIILLISAGMFEPGTSMSESAIRCLEELVYWIPGFLLMIPFAVLDLLRLSNQFAGPVFALRREMYRLIEDQSDRPLQFREGDQWMDIPDMFNQIRSELIDLREQSQAASSPVPDIAPTALLFGDDESEPADEEAVLI